MIVSGFTFLRNAHKNGYPFTESIRSILPIVDEFICVIGPSTDSTRSQVEAIQDSKIKIIDSHWNERMEDRGFVYGQQKMMAQFNCSGDWAFYLEADEVIHERETEVIVNAMRRDLSDPEVEALYFNFFHFYGTPSQVGIAGYRKAPRIIKNTLRSIAPDGLFWTILDKNKKGRYPRAKFAGANIYHYGHCRRIEKMASKQAQVGKYWGTTHKPFEGYGNIDTHELRPFNGTHPSIMREWLAHEAEQTFIQNPMYRPTRRDMRNRVRFKIEDTFKIEISKKHFQALD